MTYNDDVHRFYAPDLDRSRSDVVLSGEESHHLVRVLRLVRGDEVVVFDGRGHEYLARVVRADRHATAVAVVDALAPSPEPPIAIVLAQAVLKGDKMDGVVRDATMAGVSRIVPLVSERTFAKLSSLARAHAVERWQRVAVSSAKQCRRSRLPDIEAPMQFLKWLETPFEGRRLLLAEPQTGAAAHTLREVLDASAARPVCCIVGPEGGWTVEERRAAENAGCPPVTLGPMTLRADAAGLVAVSVVSFALENP
ncbi:MAG TPA: 16S rRNA (uracil(1498)-N(3))-methyltransferase [Vicinamibacterales bacterium]|nr:16S rRNA (uracil(1498)-N(3))-methyltransferase [Vicinamibacterales bacterium]